MCAKRAANITIFCLVQGGKVFFFQFEIPLRGMEFSHLVICGGFNELVIGSVSCRRFIHLCIFHSPQGNLFLLLLRFFPVSNHFIECKVLHAFALLAGTLLYMSKAFAELFVGLFEGIVGVNADVVAVGRQGEEQVAVFLFNMGNVVRLL